METIKIIKLDMAKLAGYAVLEYHTYVDDKGEVQKGPLCYIHDYGEKEFWGREPIDAGSKVGLVYDFVNELIDKHTESNSPVDVIWMEQLNYFRNKDTARSILHQQAGAHLAARFNDIDIIEIPTMSSYRKQEAIDRTRVIINNMNEKGGDMFYAKQITDNSADAFMLGEKRGTKTK